MTLLPLTVNAAVVTTAYNSPDDVTVTTLESNRVALTDGINSFDGSLVQSKTITPDALSDNANPVVRWNEAFNDWVSSGLTTPTTSGTLTSTTTSGVAYIDGNRVAKDATAKLYTASKWTWVDLSSTGTYTYVERSIGTSDPAVTANSIRLSRVSSDATEINNVQDLRVLSVSLDSNQENFQRVNMDMSVTTPDPIVTGKQSN